MNVSKTNVILKKLAKKRKPTLLDKPKHAKAEQDFIRNLKIFKNSKNK